MGHSESHDEISLCPAQDMIHAFVHWILPISHCGTFLVIRSPLWCCSAPVQVTLILLNNGPKVQE